MNYRLFEDHAVKQLLKIAPDNYYLYFREMPEYETKHMILFTYYNFQRWVIAKVFTKDWIESLDKDYLYIELKNMYEELRRECHGDDKREREREEKERFDKIRE